MVLILIETSRAPLHLSSQGEGVMFVEHDFTGGARGWLGSRGAKVRVNPVCISKRLTKP